MAFTKVDSHSVIFTQPTTKCQILMAKRMAQYGQQREFTCFRICSKKFTDDGDEYSMTDDDDDDDCDIKMITVHNRRGLHVQPQTPPTLLYLDANWAV